MKHRMMWFACISTKSIIISLLVLAVIVLADTGFAGGTLTFHQCYSAALQQNRWLAIYLPEGYDPSQPTRYPVIYKLHEWGGNQSSDLLMLRPLLDTMIESEQIQPLILVAPNGNLGPYGGSLWTNSALYGNCEDFVVQDVVNYVDTTFKSMPVHQARALLGFSMGAIGSMTIGVSHPDVFGVVAAHSGYFNWDRVRGDMRTAVLAENTGPPYNFAYGFGTYTSAVFMFSGGYSPNLQNPPSMVDYPYDVNGEVVESVIDRFKAHNPDVLAAAQPPGVYPHIYFDCGDQDEFFMYETNFDLAAAFDELEIPYVFRPYQGDHSLTEAKLRISLTFINAAFNEITAVENRDEVSARHVALLPPYPNPFNPRTTVSFTLPGAGNVQVATYDARGMEVARLVNATLAAGAHAVDWDGRDSYGAAMPSGTYFCRLTTPWGVETRKLQLIR